MTESKELNIYKKIKEVKKDIGHIAKTATNSFQNYKYIPEYVYLKIINPILEKHNLVMTFEDTDVQPTIQQSGKEWVIVYQKQVFLIDVENGNSLTFEF
jgi:hypothetical protein